MKKLLLCLTALSIFCAAPTFARPFGHGGYHRPVPVVVHHHKHHANAGLAIASGIIGFAAGTILSAPLRTYNTYTVIDDNRQCFAVVSKSTGNITQQCLSGDNQVLYVE